jgi:hypothetical protein
LRCGDWFGTATETVVEASDLFAGRRDWRLPSLSSETKVFVEAWCIFSFFL